MNPTRSVIYRNATFLTMDPERHVAQAVAIEGAHIKAVGTEDEVLAWRDRGVMPEVVDLDGRIVVPGFNDCHMHLLPYGLDLSWADLSAAAGVSDVPALIAALRAWAERNPRIEWVLGSRYDQNTFPGVAHPTRAQLDAAFPDRPVYVTQTSRHAAACNSVALRLAGISRDTNDPAGGEIVRDAFGEPTGVLLESAMDLMFRALPKPDRPHLVRAISKANEELTGAGITSASDLNVGWLDLGEEIKAYKDAAASGAPVRTTVFPHAVAFGNPADVPHYEEYGRDMSLPVGANPKSKIQNPKSNVRLGPTKLFSDGALTVRTAALREPFVDGSGSGMLLHEPDQLKAYIVEADRKGWQVAVHAIGDRAIELVLDCYDACESQDRRHRIEHAMVLDADLIDRFARQHVIPVVQPEFIARLGDAYVLGLGMERASRINPTASLHRAGIGVPFSSDCPIVPGAPLDGIRAAARRTTPNGTVLGSEERISLMEGLRNYTYWAAYSTFDEQNVGRIAPTLRADFAVLNCELSIGQDGITDDHLDSLSIAATIIGGETVYGALA